MSESDFPLTLKLAKQVPDTSPERQSAMLLAGEAATKTKDLDAALAFYSDAASRDATSQDGLLALFSIAEIYLEQGRLSDAESFYRAVLSVQPGNGLTNERMAFLLSITGRRWESLDHFFVLVKSGNADYRDLGLAADVGRPVEQPDFLEKCRQQAPDDPLVRLALASQARNDGDPSARNQLEAVVKANPEFISAQCMLGEMLAESNNNQDFVLWHDALPSASEDSPDLWFVRGLWARKESELETAAKCFWQAIARTKFHRRAFYSLGQTLVALKDPQAEEVAQYSEKLIQLSQTIDQVLNSNGTNEGAMRDVASLLLQLGRVWEGCAWAVAASRTFPDAQWTEEVFARHSGQLTADLDRILPSLDPASGHAINDVPEFNHLIQRIRISMQKQAESGVHRASHDAHLYFEECPVIPFVYFNADDPETKGVRTFEQTGGGVAIIDFDLDGAPDVFLPQGQQWKTGENQPTPSADLTDQLFRNHAGNSFQLAASSLPAADVAYGQGCSAGDFNNDGFPDLYVANVGRNCLYQNMGDGTFLDVTDSTGISSNSWTVSAMICDLNEDGLPDIYDVNYLTGEDLFQRICGGRACSPAAFPGARDCLLINQGDGRFVELSSATPAFDAKGLGIVCFRMFPAERPVIFIANDQVANHFLLNSPSDNPFNIELTDASLTAGLAFDENGLPMACMGIAIDDWDGNNLLDLFVTNFSNESNTLYRQDTTGLFVDATNTMGLKAVSFAFTGWGTQSLDVDMNGFPDLVVTNGHVDDYRDVGGDYQMRPQFFQNRAGRFVELFGEDIGPWFSQAFLGRGLARVDWNLDGLPEWIVSNINAPVSVLKNRSTGVGHFLRIKLVSTQLARDASGTFVTVSLPQRDIVRQLTMGDGYMASNERIVEFGLGNLDQIEKLTLRWPSGIETTITGPSVDSILTIVEGRDHAYTTTTYP